MGCVFFMVGRGSTVGLKSKFEWWFVEIGKSICFEVILLYYVYKFGFGKFRGVIIFWKMK